MDMKQKLGRLLSRDTVSGQLRISYVCLENYCTGYSKILSIKKLQDWLLLIVTSATEK